MKLKTEVVSANPPAVCALSDLRRCCVLVFCWRCDVVGMRFSGREVRMKRKGEVGGGGEGERENIGI